MNENLSQQIQSLIRQGKRYLTLQINYGKLTLAEKLTILLSGVLLVMTLVPPLRGALLPLRLLVVPSPRPPFNMPFNKSILPPFLVAAATCEGCADAECCGYARNP